MFLIFSAYHRTKTSDTTAQRLANTFRICGSGITITSLTNVIAFLVGATTDFYGIRLFCFYTSKCIIKCFEMITVSIEIVEVDFSIFFLIHYFTKKQRYQDLFL